jgi:hypothetical protein
MTHDAYSTKRVTVWNEVRDGVNGKAIKYQDGYISWCPNTVYDRDYQSIQAMSFGHAIHALKAGHRVARAGWNGKGMWLALQVPDAKSKMTLPYIYMRTVQGDLVPWLASQTDMLADDWQLLPDVDAKGAPMKDKIVVADLTRGEASGK